MFFAFRIVYKASAVSIGDVISATDDKLLLLKGRRGFYTANQEDLNIHF